MNCWWCRRERKCKEYRMRWMRGFVPICESCAEGFKTKITEVKA